MASRRERFRRWRYGRPFWGCALTLLCAAELYAATAAPMGLIVLQGVTVLGTIVLSGVLVVLGAATLAQPLLRTISGPIVVLLSLVSLLVSNFGGFLIGMVLGLVGGGMIFAWSPTKNAAPDRSDDTEPPTEDLLLPGGPAEHEVPSTGDGGRHRPPPLLSVLVWLVPALAVAVIVTTTAAPAVAQTRSGAPADLPCLIPFLCPDPTPAPEPTTPPSAGLPSTGPTAAPAPSPSSPGLLPDLPTSPPSASACAPEDYPTGDGTLVGEAAALAARILQACAKAGTPNAGTADEVPAVGIEPGVLKADRLTLEDLTYRGTVKLTTATGTRTVLEFAATRLTIVGMDLRLPFNAGTIALNGTTTATISGNVKLYAEDLSNRALGLLPLTFTANPPPLLPPIPLPSLFFTGVTSHVALVSADTITSSVDLTVH